jgi:site-specific DNA recombinase
MDTVITRAQAHDDGRDDTRQAEAGALQAQITAKESAIARYHTAFENGTMDDATAGPRLAQLTAELTQLRARHGELADALSSEPVPPSPGTIRYLAGYLPQLLTSDGSHIERKAVIETLIHEIRISDEGLIPVYQIPDPATPIPGLDTENEAPVRTMGHQVELWGFEPQTSRMPFQPNMLLDGA